MYILLLLFVSCCRINKVFGRNGEIYARSASSGEKWSDSFPIRIHFLTQTISAEKSEANVYGLVDFSDDDGCYITTGLSNVNNIKNKIIAVSDSYSRCTISKKVMLAQKIGAGGILIVLSIKVYPSYMYEYNSTSENNIIVASIKKQDFLKILSKGAPIEVILISPDITSVDPSFIVLFFLAMTCIIVGGIWAGQSAATRINPPTRRPSVSSTQTSRANDTTIGKMCCFITMWLLVVPILGTSAIIVLLYFFYNTMVIVVIVFFGLIGLATLFICLRVLSNKIPWINWIPESRISVFKKCMNITIGLLSIGIAIFWGFHRNEDCSWVIQNIFGVTICVSLLRVMEYPNLKFCLFFMVWFFIYDIFFVFITPFITPSGESIMMKIATGGSCFGSTNSLAISQGEQIPVVFKVPALGEYPSNVIVSYALLGFGDIIIPGVLVSFNHRFDVRTGTCRIYFISTVIAYGLGLFMAFVGNVLMNRGQPGLLYIAPLTLVTTLVIGYIRGEVKSLFYGITEQSTSNEVESQDTEMARVEAAEPDANVENQLLGSE